MFKIETNYFRIFKYCQLFLQLSGFAIGTQRCLFHLTMFHRHPLHLHHHQEQQQDQLLQELLQEDSKSKLKKIQNVRYKCYNRLLGVLVSVDKFLCSMLVLYDYHIFPFKKVQNFHKNCGWMSFRRR